VIHAVFSLFFITLKYSVVLVYKGIGGINQQISFVIKGRQSGFINFTGAKLVIGAVNLVIDMLW